MSRRYLNLSVLLILMGLVVLAPYLPGADRPSHSAIINQFTDIDVKFSFISYWIFYVANQLNLSLTVVIWIYGGLSLFFLHQTGKSLGAEMYQPILLFFLLLFMFGYTYGKFRFGLAIIISWYAVLAVRNHIVCLAFMFIAFGVHVYGASSLFLFALRFKIGRLFAIIGTATVAVFPGSSFDRITDFFSFIGADRVSEKIIIYLNRNPEKFLETSENAIQRIIFYSFPLLIAFILIILRRIKFDDNFSKIILVSALLSVILNIAYLDYYIFAVRGSAIFRFAFVFLVGFLLVKSTNLGIFKNILFLILSSWGMTALYMDTRGYF